MSEENEIDTIYGRFHRESKRRLDLTFDYEAAEIRALYRIAEVVSPSLMLDIGANIGVYAVYLSKLTSLSRVVAFEPAPDTFELLQRNASLQEHSRIECCNVALSESKGTTRFSVFGDLAGNNAIESTRVTTASGDARSITVKTRRLDDQIDSRAVAFVCKIDVEGHEMNVIHGAGEFLAGNSGVLQIERFENISALDEALANHGYRRIFRMKHDYYYTNIEDSKVYTSIVDILFEEVARALVNLKDERQLRRRALRNAKETIAALRFGRDPVMAGAEASKRAKLAGEDMSGHGIPEGASLSQEPGNCTFQVQPLRYSTIRLDPAARENVLLHIEYWNGSDLVAHEARPVPAHRDSVNFKTPPLVTHVACSLRTDDGSSIDSTFEVTWGDKVLPIGRHFIVIGAMKSGTTTLFDSLTQHPSICRTWVNIPGVGTSKEINYFYRQYRKGDTPQHYDWRFPNDPNCHQWTLDVSPNYTKLWKSRGVPSRIATIGGETKLAYILRHPVDRIESHMAHTLDEGDSAQSIEHCLRISRYALHLDRFSAHFPREDILLLDFAQLREKPALVLSQVCDFLGMDHVAFDTRIHNKRRVKFKLDDAQRDEFAKALRPDIERLIDEYGFKPAETWLRKSNPWWRRSPAAGN